MDGFICCLLKFPSRGCFVKRLATSRLGGKDRQYLPHYKIFIHKSPKLCGFCRTKAISLAFCKQMEWEIFLSHVLPLRCQLWATRHSLPGRSVGKSAISLACTRLSASAIPSADSSTSSSHEASAQTPADAPRETTSAHIISSGNFL